MISFFQILEVFLNIMTNLFMWHVRNSSFKKSSPKNATYLYKDKTFTNSVLSYPNITIEFVETYCAHDYEHISDASGKIYRYPNDLSQSDICKAGHLRPEEIRNIKRQAKLCNQDCKKLCPYFMKVRGDQNFKFVDIKNIYRVMGENIEYQYVGSGITTARYDIITVDIDYDDWTNDFIETVIATGPTAIVRRKSNNHLQIQYELHAPIFKRKSPDGKNYEGSGFQRKISRYLNMLIWHIAQMHGLKWNYIEIAKNVGTTAQNASNKEFDRMYYNPKNKFYWKREDPAYIEEQPYNIRQENSIVTALLCMLITHKSRILRQNYGNYYEYARVLKKAMEYFDKSLDSKDLHYNVNTQYQSILARYKDILAEHSNQNIEIENKDIAIVEKAQENIETFDYEITKESISSMHNSSSRFIEGTNDAILGKKLRNKTWEYMRTHNGESPSREWQYRTAHKIKETFIDSKKQEGEVRAVARCTCDWAIRNYRSPSEIVKKAGTNSAYSDADRQWSLIVRQAAEFVRLIYLNSFDKKMSIRQIAAKTKDVPGFSIGSIQRYKKILKDKALLHKYYCVAQEYITRREKYINDNVPTGDLFFLAKTACKEYATKYIATSFFNDKNLELPTSEKISTKMNNFFNKVVFCNPHKLNI